MSYARQEGGDVVLEVLVQPRSSRSRVTGELDGRLKIQLAAPPVDGAANVALVELLSEILGLPRSRIELAAGATGRRKRVRLVGASLEQVAAALSGTV